MTHIEWKLTLDGMMTLLAGFLAFGAVQLQIRDQRRSQAQEYDRQKKAVAKALLFEIDNFYRSHLRDPWKLFERTDPTSDNLPGARPIGAGPFPVYLANASKIGELDIDNVQAIVHFYGEAVSYLSIWEDYKSSLEWIDRAGAHSPVAGGWLELTVLDGRARESLKHMKGAIPELIKFAWLVCYYLCKFTDTDFKFPVIGVAAENISMKDFDALP